MSGGAIGVSEGEFDGIDGIEGIDNGDCDPLPPPPLLPSCPQPTPPRTIDNPPAAAQTRILRRNIIFTFLSYPTPQTLAFQNENHRIRCAVREILVWTAYQSPFKNRRCHHNVPSSGYCARRDFICRCYPRLAPRPSRLRRKGFAQAPVLPARCLRPRTHRQLFRQPHAPHRRPSD